MGEVDLHFKPSVPVFDGNIGLGRRHYKRVAEGSVEGTPETMGKAGIQRALVFSPHGAYWDPGEGNQILLDTIKDHPNLYPQLVANPLDDLDAFAAQVKREGVRSVRMVPSLHQYPFRDWAVKPWLDWLAAERIPVWLPSEFRIHVDENFNRAKDLDPTEVHDTLKAHPDLIAVLSEVKYNDFPWAFLLLKSVPNLYLELSKWVITDGMNIAIDAIGEERIVFGSGFPESAISPQLYQLHRYGFSDSTLKAICAGNLERLLGME